MFSQICDQLLRESRSSGRMPVRVEVSPALMSDLLLERLWWPVKHGACYRVPGVPVDWHVDPELEAGNVVLVFNGDEKRILQ